MRYVCFNLAEKSTDYSYPLGDVVDVLLPLFAQHYTYESLRETIRSANHILCAYEHGECRGCALMTDVGSHGGLYVILFGVRQSLQGRGIGKHLLNSLIRWARQHRYRFIYLHTESNNYKAINMYERAGFRQEFNPPDNYEELPQFGKDVSSMILYLV